MGERPSRIEPGDFLPRLDRFAVAVEVREGDALLEQGFDVLGVELEHAAKRLERGIEALVVEQGASQEQQRFQVVGVLLEHRGEPGDRLPQAAA